MNLIKLLLAFLRPGIDGDGDDKGAGADDKGAVQDDQLDLGLDDAVGDDKGAAGAGGDDQGDPKAELEAARREAREAKESSERYQRELADARAQRHAPQQTDARRAEEDRKLADPATPPLEKWQIEANRSLMEGRTAAQAALAQAQDVRDQTSFSQLAITEPAMHKRYAAKVEEKLADARSKGFWPSREAIYNDLIARDMRAGAFKKKSGPTRTNDANLVNRGRLPGARSDVSAKSGQSEHQKRIERLRNTQI